MHRNLKNGDKNMTVFDGLIVLCVTAGIVIASCLMVANKNNSDFTDE